MSHENVLLHKGKSRSLLPLLQCTWTCFLVWGKKTPPPTPLHLGVCTIHQLNDQLVTWLIDCYQQVGVNDPECSRTQMPSVFIGLKITNVKISLLFLLPQGGWAVENFEFVLNSVSSQIPSLPGCRILPSFVLHVSLLDGLRAWMGIVRFFSLLDIKYSPNLDEEIKKQLQIFNILYCTPTLSHSEAQHSIRSLRFPLYH